MRFTLDNNNLILALFAGDLRHSVAASVIRRATKADCIMTLQSLGECFRVLTVKRRLTPSHARDTIRPVREILPVACADTFALEMAMDIVGRHRISFWDAMICATAKLVGCVVIVTEDDQDGRELEGVRYVSPFNPANDGFLGQLLPGFSSFDAERRPIR